jgi:rod shape-determining protein MreD
MRWVSFGILAYLVLALHVALSGFINWGSATPNLVLPIVVFIAVNAPRDHALAGAFVLGLLQDLLCHQPIGLFAFTYGLVALFLIGAQPAVYRDHPLTHVLLTLLAALLAAAVVLFNGWAYPRLHALAEVGGPALGPAILSSLYTAALAPLLLLPLVKFKGVFGFRANRGGHHHRRGAGMMR